MLEPEFQRKKRSPLKYYLLIVFIITFIIIGAAFSFFMKQVKEGDIDNQNYNFLEDLNSEDTEDWLKVTHSQLGYSLEMPADWYKKEIGKDLVITSYDDDENIKPIKRARLEIQLVDNPLDIGVEDWWTGLYQASESQDNTKTTESITINQITGSKKIIEGPDSNPKDLTFVVLVNYNKTMYVFSASTQGYTEEEYQATLNNIILSFNFSSIASLSWSLPTNMATTTILDQEGLVNKNWQLYKNQELGFSIEYPPAWHIYSEGEVLEVGDYWQILFEDKKFEGQSVERPYIAVSVLKNQNNLNEWFDLQKEALGATNLLYNENYNLNSIEGIMYSSGGLGVSYSFATFNNNNIYRVWSLTFFPAGDTLLNYFKMLDSFRFLES